MRGMLTERERQIIEKENPQVLRALVALMAEHIEKQRTLITQLQNEETAKDQMAFVTEEKVKTLRRQLYGKSSEVRKAGDTTSDTSDQEMATYPPWDLLAAQQIIEQISEQIEQIEQTEQISERLQRSQGATLPILHALQDHFGYVDPACVPLIADRLNVSRADIQGVISFYRDFRNSPPNKRVVKLCRAEACQAVGCEDLVAHLADQHAINIDAPTSPKNEVIIESVYCLGNCALGPSALVDGVIEGRLTPARLARACGLEVQG